MKKINGEIYFSPFFVCFFAWMHELIRFEEDFFSKFCEFLVWNLSPLGIHRKLIPADQVRYPYKLISFVLQSRDQFVESLGSVFRTVVAQNDGTVA